MPGMILLEPGNRILEECVRSQIEATGKRDPIDVRLCDFDDVTYRILVDKNNTDVMKVSVGLPPFHQCRERGAQAALDKHYGEFKGEAETGFDVTLHINFANIKDPAATIHKLSLLKSKLTGGVFDHFFTALMEDKKVDKFKFDLRPDTTIFFCPRADRTTVVFEVNFQIKMDQVIANVMLKEFVAARKNIGRAPPCTWDANPPEELRDFGITTNKGCLGYMSFAILKSHLEKGKQEVVIAVLQTFRTYLQYHIKMAKSYFHSKMRKRVVELIKVLNRAKVPDLKKEKKTAAGKTFKRAV
jgi:actin related protein 2/3 complex subunit 2